MTAANLVSDVVDVVVADTLTLDVGISTIKVALPSLVAIIAIGDVAPAIVFAATYTGVIVPATTSDFRDDVAAISIATDLMKMGGMYVGIFLF